MLSSVHSVQQDDYNEDGAEKNPFKISDDDILLIGNAEATQRKLEYQRQLKLPVHERKTYAGRMKARQLELRKKLREEQEEEQESARIHTRTSVQRLHDSPAYKTIMIKDRNIEKESTHEFINRKRDIFYLEHALAVKRGEIAQLEEVANHEEKKLMRAEKLLEDDAMTFDAFLKENDKSSVKAIKMAEQETKTKLEKAAEIKRITAKIVAIKSDISKYEDILQEYKLYKDFLFKLSPPEWQEKQRGKSSDCRCSSKPASPTNKKEREGKSRETDRDKKTPQPDSRRDKRSTAGSRELPPLRESRLSSRQSVKSIDQSDKTSPDSETDNLDFEEEPELYFTKPQQLLDLLSELEEQNLSLIQNSQETEEGLEEFRQTMEQTHKNMEHEENQLKQQMDTMKDIIQNEKEKNAELELRARLFNFGKYKAEEDSTLNALGQKIEEVYRSCIGDSEANLNPLQMLTAIEGRLGELLENVEMIPADRLAMAERAKEKERRLRMRDEKIFQRKQHQEERLKKAMERAQAETKKMTGRKLMPRSQPPVRKLKNNQHDDTADKEKEEYLYFFT